MEPVFVFSFVAAIALYLVSLFLIPGKKQPRPSEIPYFDWEGGSTTKSNERFFADARGILKEAYQKFGNNVYKLKTPNGDHVFLSSSAAEALKSMSKKAFNIQEASNEFLAAKYLTIDRPPEWSHDAVRMDLTQSLARLMPDLDEEMHHVQGAEIPVCKHWTALAVHPKMIRIIALLTGRVFVGPQLNRNEEWIETTINFTTDVFNGSQMIKKWHPALRPIAQYFIPEIQRIHAHHAKIHQLLLPTLKARAEAEAKPGYEKPDDMLQWLKDRAAKNNVRDFKVQASTQLVISLAAIHTTAMAATHAVYDLAAYPKYIEPLREEVVRVLQEEDGIFTKRATSKMEKMDSFLKESQRLNPFSMTNFVRKVVKPISLPNGTPLPVGTIFSVPNSVLDREEGIWSNPDEFDGFRYYILRRSSAEESMKHLLSECSADSMSFGYGAHTCSGRFFASDTLKLILGHLVKNFDLELKDKKKDRPANMESAFNILPDPTVEIMFKRIG